jgi:hypothetical protein
VAVLGIDIRKRRDTGSHRGYFLEYNNFTRRIVRVLHRVLSTSLRESHR